MTVDALSPLISAFPRERTYLLPLMLAVAQRDGYVSEPALREIARRVHVPESEAFAVATSYSELPLSPPPAREASVCTGLSCLLAGSASLSRSLADALPEGWAVREHPCRFRCDAAPVVVADRRVVGSATVDAVSAAARAAGAYLPARPTPDVRPGEVRRLLARRGRFEPDDLEGAMALGAYAAWPRVQAMGPDEIVALVEASGLLGRGGAYFPVAAKWKGARSHPSPRYLVVNAEEGEPGVFKDRYLIEGDPHLLVDGIAIAARAIEAERVYVYVNGEAELAAMRLAAAIEQAQARGLLDGVAPIEIRRGAGGYVCGEESVILSSIEGGRAVPKLRPPFPVESGLFGRPTVINNVETLCNLPLIVAEGAAAFGSVGTAQHPGTKLICLSGALRVPGVFEVPLGISLREIVDGVGGGPPEGRTLRALLCGGPSGALLPPSRWSAPLAPNLLDEAGASPGAGGIVAIDDGMSLRDVVWHLTAYNAAESCGKCTPCREGTARMVEVLDAPRAGDGATLEALAEATGAASLCGLGQMAALPYLSWRRHFPEDL